MHGPDRQHHAQAFVGLPASGVAHAQVPNDRGAIEAFEEGLLAEVERLGYPKTARFAIRLAVEEALTNAFHHGHRGLPADLRVDVDYLVDADRVWIAVEDRGPGFRPGEVPDPTLEENLDKPSGRGLMLIRSYMSGVRHNARGNRLEMVYLRRRGG
jgi:serine/threonine-protein kinase RsbW